LRADGTGVARWRLKLRWHADCIMVEVPGALLVRGVSKRYIGRKGTVDALEDISLTVKQGQIVSLLGPSGCGKSTLLNIVAGLIPRTRGDVTIFGEPVSGPFVNLGMVFQRDLLVGWRDVRSNILLQIEMRGLKRDQFVEQADRLIEQVGLAGFGDRLPHELSGGMRQRVALCRALIHDPPLLLMDEPFGALDAMTREQMNIDIQDICHRAGKTVLFVTHSIAEAVTISDQVAIMTTKPGRLHSLIPIDLPKPRTLAVQEQPAFGEYVREIREIFQEMGVFHDASRG
jgi:NitT/TauT family transport system ATP-binding protein